MKASKILFAIMLILTAITVILYGIEVSIDSSGETPWSIIGGEYLSLWQVFGGIVCLYWLLNTLITKKTLRKKLKIFFPLAVLFMIFEKNIAIACKVSDGNVINNWLVIGAALLLSAAVDIIIPRRKSAVVESQSADYCSSTMSSHYYCLDSTKASHVLKNRLGSLTASFQNTEFACDTVYLEVTNQLGEMSITVPSEWTVECKVDTKLGETYVRENGTKAGGTKLIVNGENQLGELKII